MYSWWRPNLDEGADSSDESERPVRILIRKGTVVNADSYTEADVLIKNGKIVEIGRGIFAYKDTYVIEAKNMYVMPGGIDPSTHFDFEHNGSRVAEDFYSGTRAAVAGGTTMILDYIYQYNCENILEAIQRVKNTAKDAVCDYSLHMIMESCDKDTSNKMNLLKNYGGINSVKLYMGYNRNLMVDDSTIYNLLLNCRNKGLLPMIHAENQYIIDSNTKMLLLKGKTGADAHYEARSDLTEGEAIYRVCTIANQVNSPLYINSIMSDYAASVLRKKWNASNLPLFGEVSASALGCSGPPPSSNERIKTAYIRSPPISQNETSTTNLMKRLAKGELILTSSDDCSFNLKDKIRNPENFPDIPCGVNGVEDRMSVVWEKGVNTKLLTKCQFVAVTSTNAAKLFNLYPKKGTIAVGSDADIVVWNPNRIKQISYHKNEQNCDYNIFHGMEIKGNPEVVIVRGKLCLEQGIFNVTKGHGKFIKRKPFCKFIYEL